MKYVMISLIKIYQKIPGSWHNHCKFQPTCSNYAIGVLDEFGFFKGSYSFKRDEIKYFSMEVDDGKGCF